jgi:ornithine cyclodeaminase/alanine dehydrogenase-like protein (mu-crystallin family)
MSNHDLLVLSRADIVRLMDYSDYVDAVEAAFRAAVEGRAVAPPASALHVPNGSFHAKGAALLGDDAKVAIKINGNFPGNPAANGLPTVQGVIYLADGANGRPLAVMDSIEVTINRTAAATTLAARHLARADSRVATICGAGVQGRIQLVAVAAAASWSASVPDTNQMRHFRSPARSTTPRSTWASPDLGPVAARRHRHGPHLGAPRLPAPYE